MHKPATTSHFRTRNQPSHPTSTSLISSDGKIDKQYKLHITPSERRWWGVEGGPSLNVFDTDCGKVSIQVCDDGEFPELGRLAAAQGAAIIHDVDLGSGNERDARCGDVVKE